VRDDEFRAALRNILNQPPYTSTNHSENAQNLAQLGKHFESLAGAYKLRIKGSCEDPQATKHKLVCALNAAAYTLSSAAFSHTDAGNHAAATKAYEKRATLEQEAAGIYGALGYRERQADALQSAARALYFVASSHTRLGNHAVAAATYENTAALHQEAAGIYGALGGSEKQAHALQSAANALCLAADSHTDAGNHADSAKAHEKSAASYQEAAEVYSTLEDSEKQEVALRTAVNVLCLAADSHYRLGNHEAAEEATRESARLRTEYERILVSLATPGA
jgi:tetratricopeptide (TPR) repeat protein